LGRASRQPQAQTSGWHVGVAEEHGKLNGEEQAAATERIACAMKLFGGADAMGHFWNWQTPEEHLEEAKSKLYWREDDL
jgi:hypothetical protein